MLTVFGISRLDDKALRDLRGSLTAAFKYIKLTVQFHNARGVWLAPRLPVY